MAKRIELTKEMEEALKKANVPEEKIEELKEKGFEPEPLSLDDLDAVSGGIYGASEGGWAPDDWRSPTFWNMTFPEFAEFIQSFYEASGRDVVLEFLNEAFMRTEDWAKTFNPPTLTAYWCAKYMFSIEYGG